VRVLIATSEVGFTLSIHPAFQMNHQLTDDQLAELRGIDWGRFAIHTEDEFVASIDKVSSGTKLFIVGAKEAQIDALEANPDLCVINTPIIKSGRAMQIALFREQSISITQHRFGALQSEVVNMFN
jgi:hypothetical protein